ncbi:MAG: DUF4157 domain-containing protein [Symploca sp. SIO2E6]|nr:DUF4157 domain-containing protein [Symploca sp. SIO2E6]
MYKPLQQKSSSWMPTTAQKKSNAQLGHPLQPQLDQTSASPQAMPEYSRESADRLAANVMGGLQAKEQEQAETSKVQRQSESAGTSGFDVAPPTPPIGTVVSSLSENPIQRQCADCAQEEQEQAEAERKDLDETSLAAGGIQTKLTIGAPGDTYEQEADRVAAQVMSMSAPPQQTTSVQRLSENNNPHQIWQRAQSITPVVQKQIEHRELVQRVFQPGGNGASGDLESRLNASKGGGSALTPQVKAFMEPRFGADFSQVRVHTGSEAVQMNRELGAQAFTHGSDVYFGAGKSPGNNELTAHVH